MSFPWASRVAASNLHVYLTIVTASYTGPAVSCAGHPCASLLQQRRHLASGTISIDVDSQYMLRVTLLYLLDLTVLLNMLCGPSVGMDGHDLVRQCSRLQHIY